MGQNNMPWHVDKHKAALLVIDMQNDFVKEGAPMEVPMAREFLPNMQKIVATCKDNGIPVIYTQHLLFNAWDVSPLETAYNPLLLKTGLRKGTPGAEIIDELKPDSDEYVIEKHRYDSFHNTRLDSVLRSCRGLNTVDTLMIIGTVTSICSESAARSAFMRDYKVLFVSDANGGLDDASQQATLNIVGRVFGCVIDTQSLVNTLAQ